MESIELKNANQLQQLLSNSDTIEVLDQVDSVESALEMIGVSKEEY